MNLEAVNDARLATFEWCQMDMGDVGFYFNEQNREAGATRGVSGVAGNFAFTIYHLVSVLKQIRTRDGSKGERSFSSLRIPEIRITTITEVQQS